MCQWSVLQLLFGFAVSIVIAQDVDQALLEYIDANGLLPERAVAGLRLSSVHVAHGRRQGRGRRLRWRVDSTAVPSSYVSIQEGLPQKLRRARRLAEGQILRVRAAAHTPLEFATPRDRVRTMTALSAASLPLAAYNASLRNSETPLIFEENRTIFVNVCGPNQTSDVHNCTDPSTLPTVDYGLHLAELDAKGVNWTRWHIRDAAGNRWAADWLEGARSPDCSSQDKNGERCFGDEGVAMSVFEDETSMVLVFQGSFGEADDEYVNYYHAKSSILDEFEVKLTTQWKVGASQHLDFDVLTRRGTLLQERAIRCAFLEKSFFPLTDTNKVSLQTGVSRDDLETDGLWILVQKLVRQKLPEGRGVPQRVYLTGSGTGGLHAALVSMWLKKNEDKAYDTFAIAPPGFECGARALYPNDMDPWADQPQLHVYHHIMDAISGSIDNQLGEVCMYGSLNFVSNLSVYQYCEQMVGFTGPELLYRSGLTTSTTTDFLTPEKLEELAAFRQYLDKLEIAHTAFDMCHHWTHSPWYALMLFEDDRVLALDGKTDGGCYHATAAPRDDPAKVCTDEPAAVYECSMKATTTLPLPIAEMTIVVVLTSGLIAWVSFCLVALLKKIQYDERNWMYSGGLNSRRSGQHGAPQQPNLGEGPSWGSELWRRMGFHNFVSRDRAREARDRARFVQDKLARNNRNLARKKEMDVVGLGKKKENRGLLDENAPLAPDVVGAEGNEEAQDNRKHRQHRHNRKKHRRHHGESDDAEAAYVEEGYGEEERYGFDAEAGNYIEEVVQDNPAEGEEGREKRKHRQRHRRHHHDDQHGQDQTRSDASEQA